jgi:molybdopterin converting factor small subunit
MQVVFLLKSSLAREAGGDSSGTVEVVCELNQGITVREALAQLPIIKKMKHVPKAIIKDGKMITSNYVLQEGDVIKVIPLPAGG